MSSPLRQDKLFDSNTNSSIETKDKEANSREAIKQIDQRISIIYIERLETSLFIGGIKAKTSKTRGQPNSPPIQTPIQQYTKSLTRERRYVQLEHSLN